MASVNVYDLNYTDAFRARHQKLRQFLKVVQAVVNTGDSWLE